jgi:uncharacterized membrane protein
MSAAKSGATSAVTHAAEEATPSDHNRFHRRHEHLTSAFGNDRFAKQAEAFARFFGTPLFLGAQTLFVIIWMVINLLGLTAFDPYPFILLNLAFSLQAAYAAPLILLAQTRQAERDKANADADARHREHIAQITARRQAEAAKNTERLLVLMQQNTELTEMTRSLTERVEALTTQINQRMQQGVPSASSGS